MAQSSYNNNTDDKDGKNIPKPEDKALPQLSGAAQTLSLEFWVGLFALVTFLCAGWLAVGLGDLKFFTGDQYLVKAKFDNISGLRSGASVEVAGVPIGEVADITLEGNSAVVTMLIKNGFNLIEDDVAMIRTKGIIGDRYVKISKGGSDQVIKPGGSLSETESVVDIEDLIGKFLHATGKDDEKDSL
jgi:phospholipid/cholesterol/gamma-HCH transport system substrate-binding protein